MELKRLKTQDLQDQIEDQIKLYITKRGLKSGDPLPTEKELADRLGISRTAIRETLKAMESLGIIEVRPGIGRFIREFNFDAILNNLPYSLETDVRNFKDILEIRIGLETFFLSRDIALFTTEDIAGLEGLLNRLKFMVDEDSAEPDLITLHTDFHCALYKKSDNQLLIKLIKIFATVQRNLTLLEQYRSTNRPLFVRQHRDIIQAIKSGDSALAKKVMIAHFQEPMSWVERHRGFIKSPN
ncbi:MAG: FadR family transcriptional regulator [Spirochaetaceae bacterium]|nr:MAG: FadR family transcriptional regulator [Spirochaetaceae bacterium]